MEPSCFSNSYENLEISRSYVNVDSIGDELASLLVLPEERLILREEHLDPHQVIVLQVVWVRSEGLYRYQLAFPVLGLKIVSSSWVVGLRLPLVSIIQFEFN
jgi:hypothetical protein